MAAKVNAFTLMIDGDADSSIIKSKLKPFKGLHRKAPGILKPLDDDLILQQGIMKPLDLFLWDTQSFIEVLPSDEFYSLLVVTTVKPFTRGDKTLPKSSGDVKRERACVVVMKWAKTGHLLP